MTVQVPFVDLSAVSDGLADELVPAAERVIRRGHFILGPELEHFEQSFAAYCGTTDAVGVASGLDALTLSLRAWDIGPGDEVITPSHTFFATWLAISNCGATPVAADVDARSFTIDPSSIANRITSRTRAVIAVHLYGHPCAMDEIRTRTKGSGIHILEDAAQAHGATSNGQRSGSLGDAAAFSFYPTKNLGALGDAGAVTSSDPDFLARIRRLRNYGSDTKYVFDELGTNSRLDEIQAAFLSCKLKHLDHWNAERQAIAARYLAGMANRAVTLPSVAKGCTHVWHLFVMRTTEREAFMRHMAGHGVATQIHYPQLPEDQKAYAGAGHDSTQCQVSKRMASEVVSLPLWPGMTDAQVDLVIGAVNSFTPR